jgi:hypothetical protein
LYVASPAPAALAGETIALSACSPEAIATSPTGLMRSAIARASIAAGGFLARAPMLWATMPSAIVTAASVPIRPEKNFQKSRSDKPVSDMEGTF